MMNEKPEQKNDAGFATKIMHYAAVLTAVCLLSGAGVSLLYVASAERIEQQARKAFEQTLEEVVGEARHPRELVDDALWVAEKPGNGVRYVARGAARGYQSDIVVLVSVDAARAEIPVPEDARLHRLAVLSSAETPGLGEAINAVERTVSLWQALLGQREEPARPWFQAQFSGKNMEDLRLETEDGEIKIVTGATETSRAASEAAISALTTVIEKTAELYD